MEPAFHHWFPQNGAWTALKPPPNVLKNPHEPAFHPWVFPKRSLDSPKTTPNQKKKNPEKKKKKSQNNSAPFRLGYFDPNKPGVMNFMVFLGVYLR